MKRVANKIKRATDQLERQRLSKLRRDIEIYYDDMMSHNRMGRDSEIKDFDV